MKKKNKKQVGPGKYWICGDCAKHKNLIPPKWPVTGTFGICSHCELPIEQSLIPVCDYQVPGGPEPIWD